MIKNKKFALVYRLGALIFAVAGLLKQIGVFSGNISFRAFMYYTIQSNFIAVLLFALLIARTIKALREGTQGGVGFYPRLGMVCSVCLLVTLIVFWALLVPQGMSLDYLLSFENLAVHLITPLLCLFDYILFAEARKLKYRDVYYVCIFPIAYVIFTSIAGLEGYVYGYEGVVSSAFSSSMELVAVRFPYFFLDFDKLGVTVLAYCGGILVFFIMLSHIIYWIDRKVRKQK